MQKNSFGLWLILTLVALRFAIGMHFFREGLNKIREPKPFSSYFFNAAKGPLADTYHNLVWDRDGLARIDRQATQDAWDQYRVQVETHYGFDDAQKKRAGEVLKRYSADFDSYLDEKDDDVREIRGNVARRNSYLADRERRETPSLRSQIDRVETDLRSKVNSVVPTIDAMWQGLAHDLNGLATAEQYARGSLTLNKPGRRLIDSESIDAFIPWFDLTLGLLLITGLLARPAALAGAAFLLSVVVSQWPTAAGAAASWPQLVEALALLVVAATDAGRFAGFDALLYAWCCRPGGSSRQGTKT